MRVRTLVAAGALATGAALAIVPASPAFAVCDSYSSGCPTPPGEGLSGNEQNPGSQDGQNPGSQDGQNPGSQDGTGGGSTDQPDTLPFTGGEIVLMTAVGVAALAGGTALVLAGRRRTSTTA